MNDTDRPQATRPDRAIPETAREPIALSDVVLLVGLVFLILGAVVGVVLVQPLVDLLAGALIVGLGWLIAREGG